MLSEFFPSFSRPRSVRQAMTRLFDPWQHVRAAYCLLIMALFVSEVQSRAAEFVVMQRLKEDPDTRRCVETELTRFADSFSFTQSCDNSTMWTASVEGQRALTKGLIADNVLRECVDQTIRKVAEDSRKIPVARMTSMQDVQAYLDSYSARVQRGSFDIYVGLVAMFLSRMTTLVRSAPGEECATAVTVKFRGLS